MRRVDDFLIDRVFQPIADRLSTVVSCYGIAAFLMTGFGLEQIVYLVSTEQYWVFLLASWVPFAVGHAYRRDAETTSSVMPIDRIRYFLVRAMQLPLIPIFGAELFIDSGFLDKITDIAWLGCVASTYFMACRKNPPKPKRYPLGVPVGNSV